LTSILLNTERLREGSRLHPERITRASAAIERAASAQLRLIEELLDISRVVNGKLHLKKEPVDLSAMITAAVEPMRETAARRDLRFEVSVAPSIGAMLGDAGRLQQVVWNLVTNAFKFTPDGGTVRLEAFARDGCAILRVVDSGKGIDPRKLEDVFGEFSQEDSATNRRHGGLGLGLAIVRHLVEAHGGHVHADSAGVGRGATFTVELPLASDALLPVAAPEQLAARDDLTGIHVLLVEDDQTTRELVAEILESKGATLRAAGSADEGLAAFRAHPPDVILCDIAMPGRDGYEFVSAVRAMPTNGSGKTAIVAVTALAGDADRERILAAGFDDHIPKPIDTRRLTAVVNQCRRPE